MLFQTKRYAIFFMTNTEKYVKMSSGAVIVTRLHALTHTSNLLTYFVCVYNYNIETTTYVTSWPPAISASLVPRLPVIS